MNYVKSQYKISTEKQKIENQILEMENIQDYAKLNEEIAKKINNQIS